MRANSHGGFELIVEVGPQLGAVRAIDLEDFDPDGRVIHFRHRQEGTDEYGTPLKNGRDGGGKHSKPRWRNMRQLMVVDSWVLGDNNEPVLTLCQRCYEPRTRSARV